MCYTAAVAQESDAPEREEEMALSWRDEQFGAETVATLYDKIAAYQASLSPLMDSRNAGKD